LSLVLQCSCFHVRSARSRHPRILLKCFLRQATGWRLAARRSDTDAHAAIGIPGCDCPDCLKKSSRVRCFKEGPFDAQRIAFRELEPLPESDQIADVAEQSVRCALDLTNDSLTGRQAKRVAGQGFASERREGRRILDSTNHARQRPRQ
jgi:hypothetical protein